MSVSKKKSQAKTVREVRDYYDNVLDSLIDGVMVVDMERRIVSFSASAEQMIGRKAAEVQGRNLFTVFPGEDRLLHLIEKTLSTGRYHTDSNFSFNTYKKSSEDLGLTTSPLLDSEGRPVGVVVVFRDLSRMKSLEERVRKGERLAALGVLAAGMAHEIKNPLGGIRGATQLLRDELEGRSSLLEYTDIMIREVDRLDKIVEGLLDFSKPPHPHARPTNVHQILDRVAALVQLEHHGDVIGIRRNYDPSLPEVIGDPDQLSQVFLNIFRNGIDAMQGEGTLVLTTRILPGYQIPTGKQGKRRMISVEVGDSGSGIPPEELEKIFLPFYTRKRKGVGLGLALCHRIIEEHGGKIDVISRVGEGTRFTITLPVAAAQEL
jgi:two-component system nitrogen regulation sensor histidine kinase GlnL